MAAQTSLTQQLIIDEAVQRGWRVEHRQGHYYDVVDSQGKRVHFTLSRPDTSAEAGIKTALSKLATLRNVEALGYTVAPYVEFENASQASAFLMGHTPIVVKPNHGEKSQHITVGVRTPAQLTKAVHEALAGSKRAVLQKQLTGNEYRLLVIGDKLFAASYRRPPQVVGDGVRTIAQLVEATNQARSQQHSALEPIEVSAARQYLGEAVFTSVPAGGTVVRLSAMGSMSAGGETVDVTDIVHPSYTEAAVAITQAFGLDICGLDLLTNDIAQPMGDYLPLLEVNSAPGFKPHAYVSEGLARNPAPALLDYVFDANKRRQS